MFSHHGGCGRLIEVNRLGAPGCGIVAVGREMHYLWCSKEKTMGLHKLEIQVTDEALSRIDAAAARTGRTRAEVLEEKISELPPVHIELTREEVERRLARFDEMTARIDKLGRPGRSGEEIDREIREFREDRKHDW
jgi:hypothetical protein